MPKMITGKKTQRYSGELKVKAVEWINPGETKDAEVLFLFPKGYDIALYEGGGVEWRLQEGGAGRLVFRARALFSKSLLTDKLAAFLGAAMLHRSAVVASSCSNMLSDRLCACKCS